MTSQVRDRDRVGEVASSESGPAVDSFVNTPSNSPNFTPRTLSMSSDGTKVGNLLYAPQSSTAFSTSSQDTNRRRASFLTPTTSAVFSFTRQTSAASPQSRDLPIPSIESPLNPLAELHDGVNPKSFLLPTSYYGSFDILKEVNRDSPEKGLSAFRFGESREASPFTFRKMHNATPEPLRNKFECIYTYGVAELPGDPAVEYVTNGMANTAFKDSTAPMPELSALKLTTASNVTRTGTGLGRYDVKDEIPPHEPYFDEQFQKGLLRGKGIASNIARTLEACELAEDLDSQVYKMIQIANDLRTFDAPAVCTIGIVGDSGVGKSSLINSLLDEPRIARTAGLGKACTSVVTEYRHRKQEHKAKYTIEIDCMTDSEIDELLRELIWSYRQFYLCDLDDKGATLDEQRRLEEQSKLAWDTLQAAFGSNNNLTEEYLQDRSDGADKRVEAQLICWREGLLWPFNSIERKWLGFAETVDEYNEKTRDFISGNLWPFIKVIRIFLSSQILKSGTVLADLPGFHDANLARVKAAEAYMYDCDEILVVADITRVITNKNVELILQQSLGSNLKNGRPSQGIALVCTKSEDFDPDEIEEAFLQKGPEAEKVKRLKRDISAAEDNPDQAGALSKKNEAQDQLNYICMSVRNKHIRRTVCENHARSFPERPLEVFFVSNRQYKTNRNRSRTQEFTMQGSGIPDLRSHCHKIPARAQFRIACHFLSVKLKDLVQKVHLWLNGGSEETMPTDKTVRRLLDTLNNDLQLEMSDCILTAARTQENDKRDIIIGPMSQCLNDWTKVALKASETWSDYHPSQIAAFCRNYGSWSSPRVKYTEWNMELIEAMVEDMSLWWEHLERCLEELLDRIKAVVHMEIGKLGQDFQGATLFAETIETKLQLAAYGCSQIKNDMKDHLQLIKHNATENNPVAYIFEEMSPTYRKCTKDSGPGVNARRLRCLQQAIGSSRRPILFTAIRDRIQQALSTLNIQVITQLRELINEILGQIRSDIEILRGSEAQLLAKNGDFLDRLGIVMGNVDNDMQSIEEMTEVIKGDAKNKGYI